jgi:putative RecB family exonuclease
MNPAGATPGVATTSPLSYSSIRTYQECPQRWKFLYVDRLSEAPRGYFSFGRSVHSALEAMLLPLVEPAARRVVPGRTQKTLDSFRTGKSDSGSGGVLPTIAELLAIYEAAWVRDGYNSAEEEARYKMLGAELLLRYRASLEKERPHPIAVEPHLEAAWDGIPIHGYVDRIDRGRGGGLEILDYKTSRELSEEDARESDQLSLYQVLVERNFPDPVEALTLYHLRSMKPLRVAPRAPPRLEMLYDRVGTVSDGIRSEAFEPTPGRQCIRCEFKPLCPEFREVPPMERDRLTELVDRFRSLREKEQSLEADVRQISEELHRAAEALGVHRIPGSSGLVLRKKEEDWQYPADQLLPLLERAGLLDRAKPFTPETVRRLIRDPTIDAELRRRIAEMGSRRVKWHWELDNGSGVAQ